MAILAATLVGCTIIKINSGNKNLAGEYFLNSNLLYQALSENNYSSLELNSNGTYTLNKAKVSFTPVIEQCDIASSGKWSYVSNNVLEITSENFELKQKGFEYEIIQENKLSKDSLYFIIKFPSDYHPFKMELCFNYSNYAEFEDTIIALPKSKYIFKISNRNHIDLRLYSIPGMVNHKSRLSYTIFEENFETEKYNFYTIELPYFDRCFIEFEPYYKELIYIKNDKQLLWHGECWEK